MKQKKNKPTIEQIKYIVITMLIPLAIIALTDLFPTAANIENEKTRYMTIIFLILTGGLYFIGIVMSSKLIVIEKEFNKILDKHNDKIKNEDLDQLTFNDLTKIINDCNEQDEIDIIYTTYKDYEKSLRSVKGLDESGEEISKMCSTIDASSYFDEENIVYNIIYYKVINYITQALTGVGIFGTFLGIIQGLSGLEVGDTEVMKSGIEVLLDGVSVSFNTSLYGVLFSVLLTFILKIVIEITMKKSNEFSHILNNTIEVMDTESILERIENYNYQQNESLGKLATDLSEQIDSKFNSALESNLEKLSDKLGELITGMQENFERSIQQSNTSTAVVLNASIAPTMEKLEAVITNMQTNQEQSSGKFIEESMQAMKEALNVGTSNEMDKLRESMEIISSKNTEMVETFTSSMENMKMLTLHQENLIKNTTNSTESMNLTTENIKELQENLSVVIENIKDISSNSNVSITNINDTIEAMKGSMNQQLVINQSIESMVEKAHELSKNQDMYINKLDNMSDAINGNMESTQSYISNITKDISVYKNQFEQIRNTTIEMANNLDSKYKDIVDDLSIVNNNLSSTVNAVDSNLLSKVNNMGNTIQSLVKDLNEYQTKTMNLTSRIEKFAQVEESTQELWSNYKDSFDNLNNTINDGVENYNKHINNGVEEILTKFDKSISDAVYNLKQAAETIGDVAEDILEGVEAMGNDVAATK